MADTPRPAKSKRAPHARMAPPPVAPLDALLLDALAATGQGLILCDATLRPLMVNDLAREWLGTDDPTTVVAALQRFVRGCEHYLPQSGVTMPATDLPLAETLALGTRTQRLLVDPNGEWAYTVEVTPVRRRPATSIVGALISLRDATALWRADQGKDDFVHLASHELQAPLQSLMLASRLIQRRATQPERFTDLPRLSEEITVHARRMSHLITDMQALSRITSGRYEVNAEPCDVARIIHDAVAEQQNVWKRDIQLTQRPPSVPCLADGERIWQVLTNLLTNAIKYSAAPAPIEVAMTLMPSDSGAPRLICAITDHGQGIAVDQLPHVFGRFYRASVTNERDAQQQRSGMGLGLYIAHAIIAAHGGRLTASSTVGVGSTFTFWIPAIPLA